MLKISLIGHLGKDAELISTGEHKFISMSIAESGLDKNKQTTWVQCTLSVSDENPTILQYLTTGKELYLEGSPHIKAYLNKDGKAQASLGMYVNQLQLLGNKKE